MRAFAEAPAKVIVTGEHFVVHGAWALAAAIGKKVRVEVSDGDRFLLKSNRFPGGDRRATKPVQAVVDHLASEYSFSPKVRVSVESEIPQGAGLGSSAATMVALVAALGELHGLRLTPKEVVGLSMVGEQSVHGKPSGIDPTICTYGGVLLFRPGSPHRKVAFSGTRSFLVSYSGKSRSTRRQINRVAGVKELFPTFFDGLAESVSSVSEMAAVRIKKGDMQGLGNLLTFNQAVLTTVGVSNESLDRLVRAFLRLGAYGAKLTGAGGGGSVLGVSPGGKEKRIISGLNARGFETFRTDIPVTGVKSWPGQ